MTAAAGGDAGAGIGSRLRAAREKKGLTILQAAEKMHVDSRILEALEAEDFASLGAAVYARGHLRHYADLVGERAAELVELYSSSAGAAPAQPDLTRISRALPDSDPSKLGGTAVVALVTIAIVGTLWWFINSSGREKPQPEVVQQSQQSGVVGKSDTSSAAAPAAGAVSVPKPTSPAPRGPGMVAVAPAATRVRTAAPDAPAVPRSTASSAAVTAPAAARAMPVGASEAAGVPPLTRPNPTPRAKEAELTLRFSSDSWAEVYDAAGQRLFYDVGAASSAHTVKGPAPLRVVLGNAAGVALEYNGRPAAIPSGVLPDGSVHFVITARGRTAPATDGD